MIISAYTVGDENVASSRLRSFYLFKSASKFDLTVIRNSNLRALIRSDCLHIQKKTGYKIFLISLAFRITGRKVIYDFDDHYYGKRNLLWMIVHMLVASKITTDTDARKLYWQKILPFKSIEVLPDIIDVEKGIDFPALIRTENIWKYKLVWIGSESTVGSIYQLIMDLKDNPIFELTIITHESSIIKIAELYPWVKTKKWNKSIIFENEYRLNMMVLNHNVTENTSILKSENKMVLAIAAGVIPIVSNTPAYMSLAKNLDAENLVFNDLSEIYDIINSLSIDWVESFFQRARTYIQLNYESEVVLKKFIKILTD